MTKSAIAKPTKRPPTPAERLSHLDPDLAVLFDEWEDTLNRSYDLAVNENPAPPILDAEERLAYELGLLDLTVQPVLGIADGLRSARDEAFMVLGRVEQLIAQRTLEAVELSGHTIHQGRIAPPPDRFDGGDPTEGFHVLRAEPMTPVPWADPWPEAADAPDPEADTQQVWVPEWRAKAVRVGGWWRRTWTALRVTAGRAATALWGLA